MYRGFKLSLGSSIPWSKSVGESLYKANGEKVKSVLDSFLTGNGTIDGGKLQENWFPQIEADVFISHSHKDKDAAIAFAGWLSTTFGLKPFIDSCVWGYANELLTQIDKKYSGHSSGSGYDYEKIKYSASHVYMMLAMALGKMLDNTECLIFINTPNSISANDVISKTLSPWLYMEMVLSGMLRENEPKRRGIRKAEESLAIASHLQVEHNVDLGLFATLDGATLQKWQSQYTSRKHALDVLYGIV
jgi:hypothetical protein